jgi:hypothetical protein
MEWECLGCCTDDAGTTLPFSDSERRPLNATRLQEVVHAGVLGHPKFRLKR